MYHHQSHGSIRLAGQSGSSGSGSGSDAMRCDARRGDGTIRPCTAPTVHRSFDRAFVCQQLEATRTTSLGQAYLETAPSCLYCHHNNNNNNNLNHHHRQPFPIPYHYSASPPATRGGRQRAHHFYLPPRSAVLYLTSTPPLEAWARQHHRCACLVVSTAIALRYSIRPPSTSSALL